MKIRSKKDAREVVERFEEFFKFDNPGQKYYVYFQEKGTANTLTIMKYPYNIITLNRRGEDWAENGESLITKDECIELIWKNRAEINTIIELRLAKRNKRGLL